MKLRNPYSTVETEEYPEKQKHFLEEQKKAFQKELDYLYETKSKQAIEEKYGEY